MPTVVFYLAALAVGVGSSVQSSMNAALTGIVGVVEATFVSVTGTWAIVIVALLLGLGSGNLARVTSTPWYLMLGGVFGAAFLFTANKVVPAIGTGAFISAVIVGQLTSSVLLDQIGAFGNAQRDVDAARIAGVVLMLVGMKLVIK